MNEQGYTADPGETACTREASKTSPTSCANDNRTSARERRERKGTGQAQSPSQLARAPLPPPTTSLTIKESVVEEQGDKKRKRDCSGSRTSPERNLDNYAAINSDALLGKVGVLGAVENLHDEGNGDDVSHIGGFGGAGTASYDVADARPESPLVENTPEVLSVGITGHSRYSPAK